MTTDTTDTPGDRVRPKHDPSTLGEGSWAVHGGNRADATTGAIRTPIVMANSYRLPHDPQPWTTPIRTRWSTPASPAPTSSACRPQAAMDNGEAAGVFATGMATLHAAFLTVLSPGDNVIASNVLSR